MSKIFQIIKGFIYYSFSKNKKLYDSRIRFCNVCPRKGKYLVADKCKECGCLLSLKLRVEDAECPLQKW